MTDERGRERVRLREIHRGGGETERKRGKNGTVETKFEGGYDGDLWAVARYATYVTSLECYATSDR